MSDTIAREAAKILIDTKSVLFNAREPFKYTSGNIGPVYVDCRRPISFPAERTRLMDMAAQVLREEIGADQIDIVAGAETAGIPYGAFVADRLEKPMIYIRKKAKGHGRMSQIEGHFDEGTSPRVLLVEDLQNFGASKKVFVDALREAGARIDHFFVLFNYGNRPEVDADNEAMGLTGHALCTWRDILAAARAGSYFDAETLDSVEAYLDDPQGWVKAFEEKSENAA
ncbi:MAG: orotate phosphoribosyltransferase [Rhodospirillales bacterium]|nr:orotate phosphoribosyltransferase [Rhodospirillales bacterium]